MYLILALSFLFPLRGAGDKYGESVSKTILLISIFFRNKKELRILSKFSFDNSLKITNQKYFDTDLNDQIGHYNITTFKGRRYSSSKAFLNPILKNQILIVMI